MTLEPLRSAPPAVLLHLATVVPAFIVGTWLLFVSRKGSRWHRLLGRLYLSLMATTALAAIFIRAFSAWSVGVGPFRFGLLHLFVLLTAWSVFTTLRAVRRGDIAAHRGSMIGLYVGGLGIAGLLAFLPGRIMYRMFFG
ncbi:MAG: DUF2306 domain-containing protein [Acidobacteria bacterium]|nr:DUF2306 domain-containing protein [Acidobacteriota bacterium]